MKFYTRQRRTPAVIIVSLIDIFAILLIFVIVTTTFKNVQPEVAIRLPESSTAGPSEKSDVPVLLSISADGKIHLAEKPVEIADLPAALAEAAAQKQRIAMKADQAVEFGTIIAVLDALKKAGITGNVSAFTKSAE